MNIDTAMFLFGALCFGMGALITSLFWAAAMHRAEELNAANERLRRHLRNADWTEARW